MNVTHGESRARTETTEYRIWKGIKSRCLNPNVAAYRYYGGRGIGLCDRWRDSFQNFLTDVGRRPGPGYSIDRIDNDGHYEPGNVRWATAREQNANKRPSIRRR